MTATPLAALRDLPYLRAIVGEESTQLRGVASDSRRVEPGDLFAVISGAQDGARFAPQAVAAGAVALLSDRALELGVPVVQVDDVRAALGPIAHRVYGQPTHALRTVAVTGTNGKTTVSHLVEQLLLHVRARPALLGTIALRGPAYARSAELTTPEADVIARFARDQLAAGATHLLMEASSHALEQQRLSGARIEVAAFTNLTQDHLDYHGTMEAYGAAKRRLFLEHAPAHSVIVVDHPFGRDLSQVAAGQVLRASLHAEADAELRVRHFSSTRAGIQAEVLTPSGAALLESPLFGAHNLENLLVALGVGLALGLPTGQICEGLACAPGAPGRMERVPCQEDLMVLVDYAHTPDAVERALAALRPLTRGRLFVVCGCGGDRDRKKRGPMGEAATRGADLAVLTSDNPRTEDPGAILAEMEAGARRAGARLGEEQLVEPVRGYTVIADRSRAIQAAIVAARPGDTVLLAGKGHENYQIIGRDKRPFDDRLEAVRALAARGAR